MSDLFLRSQSDERLVSLAQAGHVRAFATIVERYRPELSALARRLSSDGRGEDILQQAFLSAFVALRGGSEVRHLRGWLYQIVRNSSAREQHPPWVPLESTTPAADTLEDVVQRRALARSTLSELAQLPDRQRQAILGTAVDGLARAEVAQTMGLSDGAVRQLVHRARATLRSAVTAVTPWPLARWLAAARAGAAPSGGVAMKVGVVVASGTLATGIATVAIDVHGSHRPPARAIGAVHARPGHQAAQRAGSLASVALPASAGAAQGHRATAVAVAEVSLRRVGGAGKPNAPARQSERWRGDRRGRAGSSGRDGSSDTGAQRARQDHHETGGGGGRRSGGGERTQGGGGGQDTRTGGGGQDTPTGGGGQYTQGGTDQYSVTIQGALASSVPPDLRRSDYRGDSQASAGSSQLGRGSGPSGGD